MPTEDYNLRQEINVNSKFYRDKLLSYDPSYASKQIYLYGNNAEFEYKFLVNSGKIVEKAISVASYGIVTDGVSDLTSAFQHLADIGGGFTVPKGVYVIDSVSITKDFHIECEPGVVFKRAAGADVSRGSWWVSGAAMFEIDNPGLTVHFSDFTYDGNNSNQPAIEPTGHFLKTYPTSVISSAPTVVNIDRANFINGTSGYLNLRGDDYHKRYETRIYLNECYFSDTIYGKGKGDPSTPTALGYSPTYVMLMDYVKLRTNNFRAEWISPTLTGQYAACAINGTFYGTTYANSGESSVYMHGTTSIKNLGRSAKKYNDDNDWVTNNGIGAIDMYGNGDSLFIENLVATDCQNVPARAKGSLKNYTVLNATLNNCHRGLQVGPSSTGPCETVVKIGNVNAYGGTIPLLEFVGSTTNDRLRSVSIESAYLAGDTTNPENLSLTGLLHARNVINLTVNSTTANAAPVVGLSIMDVKNCVIRDLNIDGSNGVGIYVSAGDSFNLNAFTINSTLDSGITMANNPKKIVVDKGRITNAVNYGIFSNNTTSEMVISGVEVDTLSGTNRGFYAGGGNVAFFNNKTVNVTTPLFIVAGTRKREQHNSWNAAENKNTAAPTAGTWSVGDIIWNTAPAASGVIGWVCVTAGTPGTWKSFGSISA